MYLNRKTKKILEKNPYVGEKLQVEAEPEGDGIEIEQSSSSSQNSDKDYADMLDPNALSSDSEQETPEIGSKRAKNEDSEESNQILKRQKT